MKLNGSVARPAVPTVAPGGSDDAPVAAAPLASGVARRAAAAAEAPRVIDSKSMCLPCDSASSWYSSDGRSSSAGRALPSCAIAA